VLPTGGGRRGRLPGPQRGAPVGRLLGRVAGCFPARGCGYVPLGWAMTQRGRLRGVPRVDPWRPHAPEGGVRSGLDEKVTFTHGRAASSRGSWWPRTTAGATMGLRGRRGDGGCRSGACSVRRAPVRQPAATRTQCPMSSHKRLLRGGRDAPRGGGRRSRAWGTRRGGAFRGGAPWACCRPLCCPRLRVCSTGAGENTAGWSAGLGRR